MYTVYQVPHEHYYDDETGNFNGKFNPTRMLMGDGEAEDQRLICNNINAYKAVAEFDVDNVEMVYTASNHPANREYWESKTKRLASMHSVSVGDLVQDPDNKFWFCARNGWREVGSLNAALKGL